MPNAHTSSTHTQTAQIGDDLNGPWLTLGDLRKLVAAADRDQIPDKATAYVGSCTPEFVGDKDYLFKRIRVKSDVHQPLHVERK